MKNILNINSITETNSLSEKIAEKLSKGDVILLTGDLGAGKTTLSKYLVKALGSPDIVTSPTFVILNIYKNKMPIYHFDLYRLNTLDDLENVGGIEYLPSKDGITLVEWADRIPEAIPDEYLHLDIHFEKDDEKRKIIISGVGKKYEEIAKTLTRPNGHPLPENQNINMDGRW